MYKWRQGKKFSVVQRYWAQQSLFVYGTLKRHSCLWRVLGRVPYQRSARLFGYRRVMLYQNGRQYPDLQKSLSDSVPGFVLQVYPAELALLDDYEGAPYCRTRVKLGDGSTAWVYCSPPTGERHPNWLGVKSGS